MKKAKLPSTDHLSEVVKRFVLNSMRSPLTVMRIKMGNNPLALVFVLFTKKRTDSFVFIVVTFKSFQKYILLNSQSRCSKIELLDYKHF